MRGSIVTVACAAALALAAAAGATTFGVAEDAGKYANDGGAGFFADLNDLGMTENRMAIFWDASRPDTIIDKAFLDRSLPEADAHGIRVQFSVMPLHPTDLTATPSAPFQFAAFLQQLAREYPQVTDYIVGNEPNQPRFWRPQFVRGVPVAGAAYERVLALSYDALKQVDPTIRVIGVGLSPRGNDAPNAPSNVSTSPVRFIHDMGVAYRASGRRAPIMDAFAFHPYPNPGSAADPISRGYRWPNAGFVNLDRIEQAVWDAFADTGQPTFAESARTASSFHAGEIPLRFVLDETGWQTRIPAASRTAYTGRETSQTVSEATQAQIYRDLVTLSACDANVDTLNFFHLIDETDLDRFQSGLIRADGTRRPSYSAVRAAIGLATTVGCTARRASWEHATDVVGASVRFAGVPRATAAEDATYRVGLFRVDGPAALDELPGWRAPGLVASRTGALRAYWPRELRLRAGAVAPGWYAYAVQLSASMNPQRTSVFVGRPFRVG
jgi:hypothetical protein